MFKDFQRLFQKSMAAFRAELNRREPEDQVAELLTAMRRELVAAKASISDVAEELRRAQAELDRERELLRQCQRRGALAERINDAETVRVAAQFADRHRERVAVLEQRVSAAQAEHSLRTREAEEMRVKYQQADANRFALVAQLRRSQAQQQLRSQLDGTSGPLADFARMERAVEDGAGYSDALESLTGLEPAPPPSSTSDVEDRLRELKRRMGQE